MCSMHLCRVKMHTSTTYASWNIISEYFVSEQTSGHGIMGFFDAMQSTQTVVTVVISNANEKSEGNTNMFHSSTIQRYHRSHTGTGYIETSICLLVVLLVEFIKGIFRVFRVLSKKNLNSRDARVQHASHESCSCSCPSCAVYVNK